MTLLERYNDLTQPLTLLGKTYPAVINEPLSIASLEQYAERCKSSNAPILKSIGKEVSRNIFNSGYNLNGTI